MKFYPTPDVWFCVDKRNGWDSYEKHPKHYSWKLPPTTGPHIIRHWRDFDGVKLVEVKREHLCLEDWPKTRIRKEACLGLLYSTGYRFIKLSRAPPSGFKCAPMPINLAMAITAKQEIARRAKLERQAAKKAKQDLKAQKAKGKKGRGKK